jgi:hypothetical protein
VGRKSGEFRAVFLVGVAGKEKVLDPGFVTTIEEVDAGLDQGIDTRAMQGSRSAKALQQVYPHHGTASRTSGRFEKI